MRFEVSDCGCLREREWAMGTQRYFVRSVTVAVLLAASGQAFADDTSAGANGINSRGLGLTGAGVSIGQVETGRPGRTGHDANGEWYWDVNGSGTWNAGEQFIDLDNNTMYSAGWINAHPDVQPAAVFSRNNGANQAPFLNPLPQPGGPWARESFAQYNQFDWAVTHPQLRNHPMEVASVMIGTGAVDKGVAPGASLYSGAMGIGASQDDALITTQRVQLAGATRAINHSYGFGPQPNADGLTKLAMGVDYLATRYRTLHVVAGDETQNPVSNPGAPSDAYNVMNVASSTRVGGEFTQVSAFNVTTVGSGGRRTVHITAPGEDIAMAQWGTGGYGVNSGTSFAAPHVTAVSAMLQERGNSTLLDTSYRDHRVQKAIIMNSADKLKDDGTRGPLGALLGMEKTIRDKAGNDWFSNEAYYSDAIPLDDEIGVGQLNASRALRQFNGGEYNPDWYPNMGGGGNIPLIGWSDGVTDAVGRSYNYTFVPTLTLGSFISITLCWDRVVTLADANNDGLFTGGENFAVTGLANFSLFLERDYGNNNWAIDRQSTSLVDNTEHIFARISGTGRYRIRVEHTGGLNTWTDYGLAWWTVPAPGSCVFFAVCWPVLSRRRK